MHRFSWTCASVVPSEVRNGRGQRIVEHGNRGLAQRRAHSGASLCEMRGVPMLHGGSYTPVRSAMRGTRRFAEGAGVFFELGFRKAGPLRQEESMDISVGHWRVRVPWVGARDPSSPGGRRGTMRRSQGLGSAPYRIVEVRPR